MKALVVCIDGTWNAPGQRDEDPSTGRTAETRTNVALTWEALTGRQLDPARPYGSIAPLLRQPGAALYLSGVGSSGSRLAQLVQGATGRGLAERIRDAYRFLSERWQPGDRIYGFGFSRGAFAVRSLMGFIACVGLPRANNLVKEHELARLYRFYRRRNGRPLPRPDWTMEAPVEFLGLWETVGALAFGRLLNGYHELSPANVAHVCHAVALDEERRLFWPELWTRPAHPGQVVEEVLFAGAHTNIGGGYCDARLSSIALAWMLEKARLDGLEMELYGVHDAGQQVAQCARRPSYVEFWQGWPVLGPLVTRLGLDRARRAVHGGQRLHDSVLEAMRGGRYRPSTLEVERLLAS